MFKNLSTKRILFIAALLVMVLTVSVGLVNSAIRVFGVNTFTPRAGANGGQRMDQPPAPDGFVPPSDFKPRNLNTDNNDNAASDTTRGQRVPGFIPGASFAGRGGNSALGSLFQLGIDPRWMMWIGLAFSLIGLGLLLFTANGALRARKWSLNLGTVLALIILISAIPSLLTLPMLFQRGFNLTIMLTPVLSIFNTLAAAIIIVLAILPSFRDEFAEVEKGEDDR